MSNRLSGENSPYLLQHAENPVDWYPWGDEALETARREDKPIFLSIGYAACHWCHVMAHESFEDPRIAALMNEYFVSIKVDREERPDLDAIYMNAVVSITGSGGWPMSVFLTPEGEPFYGGTYFPPVRRHHLPSFEELLRTVARLWKDDRENLLKSGREVTEHIRQSQPVKFEKGQDLASETLDQASFRLAQSYDWKFGGWGQAPKFPQPMALEFLLSRAVKGDSLALDVAVHDLRMMSAGGMYDLVGGGFCRYSTDNNWLVPHFEKMLYDNALLSKVYLYASLVTGEAHFLEVCKATLDFMRWEMMDGEGRSGGFYSSLDADSEGVEGKYYVWSYAEIVDTLQRAQAGSSFEAGVEWWELFVAAYGVTETGNFEGQSVLQRVMGDEELSEAFHLSVEQVRRLLEEMRVALFERRQARPRPGVDDKAILSWNALALWSFSEAARYLHDPVYLETAQKNAAFLCREMFVDGQLYRSWRNGNVRNSAYLEDYAALILALLSLYQADHQVKWYRIARELTGLMLARFEDPAGGFFDTSVDHDNLLIRPKDLQDNATPCGNSLAALALSKMASFSEENEWLEEAERMCGFVQGLCVRYPLVLSNWLCAIYFNLSEIQQIAILSSASDLSDLVAYEKVAWEAFRPDTILAASPYPPETGAPELLKNRTLLKQQTTAYLCKRFTCKMPVNSPEGLANQLLGRS